ncbi:uncharacterized protein LOC128295438 [Gossypium arboreum]|uniref:uncharacterized protein LOC128295438 n=1 Tax=Gossypium arboreum TaxID=29729 RepID=UPI0022F18929|nr:uncharacterized protein LOC128295438 [Gossypium arboreum]
MSTEPKKVLNGVSTLTSKLVSSAIEPIEVHVVNSQDGLSVSKHTAVSFKVKGSLEDAILKKASPLNTVASKSKNMGKLSGSKKWGSRPLGKLIKSLMGKDLGFIGPSFTCQRGNTQERRDRALTNDGWISTFPQTLVYHLSRIKSDHKPILLNSNPEFSSLRGRLFHFLAGWTKHTNFKELVVEKWRFSGNMADSLSDFTSHVKNWNKFVYGFIGMRKRQLLRSLGNIQKAMDQSNSRRLVNLEMEVRDELESVLNHEELLWRQKARCDWLQFGDRNTKFFHSRTLQRRKFNRIMALRINNEEWCSDQSILSDEAARFFENLYGKIPNPMPDLPLNTFPRLKDHDIDFLKKPVLNVEIKKALFDMAPLKAPGSDGFHVYFFQSQWDLVGRAVCEWVQVIANRFKVVFPNFISLEQADFIASRSILDNIIIVQEIIHSMRSRKAGRNWMAIKLDLEKAYDKISWNFIDASLVAAGILEILRKLGQLISSEISSGRWQPIRLSGLGPTLSHLFFADDLVIFCKAEMNQAIVLKEILNRFCAFSGHKISVRKSNMFFAKGVDTSLSDQIRRITLAQSVLLSVPNYFMQSLLVPKGICDEIERITKQSIWGGSVRHFKTVGDGSTIRGWKDIWIPNVGSLYSYVSGHDRLNLDSTLKDWDMGTTWSCLFGLISWRIWKNRNLFIFQNIKWTDHDVLKSSISWAHHFEPFSRGNKDRPNSSVILHHFSQDLVYLFTDRAVARASGNASAGGMVRDRDGSWILGFKHYLGRCCSPLEAS